VIQHQVVWFTGLSGAGKTTISQKVADRLEVYSLKVLTLDGDVVRSKREIPLGFTPEDIRANNKLIVEICRDSLSEYDVILVPVISPFADSRAHAKHVLGNSMAVVYVHVSLREAAQRDPKGLYRDQESGKLQGLIGVAEEIPYEPPEHPDLILDTESSDVLSCANQLVEYILSRRGTSSSST